MSKMIIELGGKYSAGEAFNKANEDVKKFGRTNKDAIKAGTDSLRELEKGFGEDIGKAVGTAKSVISGLAQGGIWGAIGAAAGAAIGAVVDWFKKAGENAKAFAKAVSEGAVNAIKGINEKFQQTQGEIKKTQQAAEDALGVLQGKRAEVLQNKIYEIHTQTLQKITDNMSDKAVAVVKAEEKLAVALETQGMLRADATDKLQIAKKKEADALDSINDAMDKAHEAYVAYIKVHFANSEVMGKRALLEQKIAENEQRYNDGLIKYKEYQKIGTDLVEKKNELEKEHGDVLKNVDAAYAEYLKVVEAQKGAEEAKVKATQEREKLESQLAIEEKKSQMAVDDARQGIVTAKKQLKESVDKEKEATDKEAAAKDEAAAKKQKQIEEQEQKEAEAQALRQGQIEIEKECYRLRVDSARWLKIYNQQISEGASHEEAMDEVRRQYQSAKANETKITQVCAKYKLDEKEYIRKFNEMTDKGIDEVDAYAQLQRDLNDELKKRKEAEKEATDLTNDNNKGNGNNPLKPNNQPRGQAVDVRIGADIMGDLGDKIEGKFSFKDWQEKMRQEQRKARDEKNNMKIDQPKMVKALKGEMPEAEAKQWMEYAKKKYTPDQMRELGKLAMNKEILSKKEQQRQLRAVEKMAQEIAKSLTIK